MCTCHLFTFFFRSCSFSLWWLLAFSLTFSCFSFIEICLLCFYISLSSSFSIFHVSVDIKIQSERRLSSVDDFSLQRSEWLCDIDLPPKLNAQVLEMRKKEASLFLKSGRYYTTISRRGGEQWWINRVFQKFVRILRKACNACLGNCKLIQVRNLSY